MTFPIECPACHGYGGDGVELETGEKEFHCEVCGGWGHVRTQEQFDSAVQSSRDQGIVLFINGFGFEVRPIGEADPDYRYAFAYARAYEAEKGDE